MTNYRIGNVEDETALDGPIGNITIAERDAIWAGLRLLQTALSEGLVTPDDGDIGAIYTCSGEHAGLSQEGIDYLCDRLGQTAGRE